MLIYECFDVEHLLPDRSIRWSMLSSRDTRELGVATPIFYGRENPGRQGSCPLGVNCFVLNLKAPPGFEPGMKVLQTSALPLGYGAAVWVGGDHVPRERQEIDSNVTVSQGQGLLFTVPTTHGADRSRDNLPRMS
jgi:hypothetical protein